MNDIMSVRRSSEEGKYLLQDGDCIWRVNQEGMVDCRAQGHTELFEFLTDVQQWKMPSLRLFQRDPLQDRFKT